MLLSYFGLLASAISAVVASGTLGFNIGYETDSSECKTTSDWENDFEILKSYSTSVKTYTAADCDLLLNIGPALKKYDFQIYLGVWPTMSDHYKAEKEALVRNLPFIKRSYVAAFVVGSEHLYRGDLTADELSADIDEIRELLKTINDEDGKSYEGIPVGTVDSWNVLVDGANNKVIKSSDFIMANAFSYWQGQTMANASYSFFDDIMQVLQTIQTVKGSTDIDFWIGETGWPTEGTSYESSVPSLANAKQFWNEGICAIRAWGINTFVFEAFDESWKPDSSGTSDVEKHWGFWGQESGSPKFDLTCEY